MLLRPRIGDLLPTFVIDKYEGFATVRRFVDLTDEQLDRTSLRMSAALRAAVAWHDSRVVIAGHAIPGPVIAGRALGHGPVRREDSRQRHRVRDPRAGPVRATRARGAGGAECGDRRQQGCPGAVRGAGAGDLGTPACHPARCRHRCVPTAIPAGRALLETADLVNDDPCSVRGRPASLDQQVVDALARRDVGAIDALAGTYDRGVPDPGASASLRRLAGSDRPIVGYLGKLIPQKGVELLLAARGALPQDPVALIVGFGSHREWLTALAMALRNGDDEALEWLRTPDAWTSICPRSAIDTTRATTLT